MNNTLILKDLDLNKDLDRTALTEVRGGWFPGLQMGAGVHSQAEVREAEHIRQFQQNWAG